MLLNEPVARLITFQDEFDNNFIATVNECQIFFFHITESNELKNKVPKHTRAM